MDNTITLLEGVQQEYSKKRKSAEIIMNVLLNGHCLCRTKRVEKYIEGSFQKTKAQHRV